MENTVYKGKLIAVELTCPLFPISSSTMATGVWIWAECLDCDLPSTLQVRPRSSLSQRLWFMRLSRIFVLWLFQNLEMTAAWSDVIPPCFLVWAVRSWSTVPGKALPVRLEGTFLEVSSSKHNLQIEEYGFWVFHFSGVYCEKIVLPKLNYFT